MHIDVVPLYMSVHHMWGWCPKRLGLELPKYSCEFSYGDWEEGLKFPFLKCLGSEYSEVFKRPYWAALWMGPKWPWNSSLFPVYLTHTHNLKVILCGDFRLGFFWAAGCHMRSDRNFPHIDSGQLSKCVWFWNISNFMFGLEALSFHLIFLSH